MSKIRTVRVISVIYELQWSINKIDPYAYPCWGVSVSMQMTWFMRWQHADILYS